MQTKASDAVLRNLASPYGLACVSFLVFFGSWIFPPTLYASVMRERDILFLNPPTFFFYMLCVAGFSGGVWLTCPRSCSISAPTLSPRISPYIFLFLPILAGLTIALKDLLQTFRETPDLILMLAAQQATDLKGANALVVQGPLSSSGPPLVALGWWSLWRFWQLRLSGWRAYVVQTAIGCLFLLVVCSSFILVSRNLVMEAVAGTALLYVLHREAEGRLSPVFAARVAAGLVAAVIALFGAFSFIRGTASFDDQLYLLLGYSAASYNRLAALIVGSLHYPFAGHGLYLSGFASFNETFHHVVPLDRLLHWPSFFEEWTSEFGAVERSGLNGSLIFLGAFGFIFCDIGWFSPLWLVLYGMLYGVVWKAMRQSSVFGVICYPFFGFCVLFWFGTNLLLDSSLVPFVKCAAYLFFYEKLFLKTESAPVSACREAKV